MYGVAVVGLGYWGPNLVRNFYRHPGTDVVGVVDLDEDRVRSIMTDYPRISLGTNDYNQILKDERVDIVAIATPVETHYELAKKALLAGKHVWVEKPLCGYEQAKELARIAGRERRVLFVDHTFVYTGAVRKIKELVDSGQLGTPLYYDSMRVNLGLFRSDVDVIWDLAVHDLSILRYLFGWNALDELSVAGTSYKGYLAMANIALRLVNGRYKYTAHIDVSWLSPVKVRTVLIGGTDRMILYDDLEPSEKVKLYDKSVLFVEDPEEISRMKVEYRTGDVLIPRLDGTEALRVAVSHFLECIEEGKEPVTGIRTTLDVLWLLETISKEVEPYVYSED